MGLPAREAVPVLPAALAAAFMKALTQAGDHLAELVGRDIAFVGSHAEYMRLEDLPLCYDQGPESAVTAVYLAFSGGIEGHVVLAMRPNAADSLSHILLMYDAGLDSPDLRYLADNMVGELGNVAASAFLNAVADAAHLRVLPTAPAVVHDMWGAVLQTVVVEVAHQQSYGILVEASIIVEGNPLGGTLILLPSLASCKHLEAVLALADPA